MNRQAIFPDVSFDEPLFISYASEYQKGCTLSAEHKNTYQLLINNWATHLIFFCPVK